MKKLVLVLILVFGFAVSPVWAQPYSADLSADNYASSNNGIPTPDDTGTSPQVWEAIDRLLSHAGLPGISSNEEADPYYYNSPNSYWTHLGGSGSTASDFAAISITAGNNNTLSVYQKGSDLTNPAVYTDVIGPNTGDTFLGAGTFGSPYPGGINPFTSGEDFGFSLQTVSGNTTKRWYSDPSDNTDQIDHMIAYYMPQLAGTQIYIDTGSGSELLTFSADTYILAWEDLALSDSYFDDDYNDTVFAITRVAPVPEPMSMLLLGSGLFGLVGLRKKRRVLSY